MVRGTLADVSIGSGFADGGRVTGVLIATVQGDTSNVRKRVWPVA